MKIVSYLDGSRPSFGVVTKDGERVVDVPRHNPGLGEDLKAALAAGKLDALRSLEDGDPDHRLADLDLLPVIPNPSRILCIGINYQTHLAETGRDKPAHPMIFLRLPESQIGSGQPLLRPRESTQLDFEGELAVVIGKRGRRITKADALAHVAGYSCYNDGSVRDWQRHTIQFTAGKNFPATGGFGPWLVTIDVIPDPARLTLETRLNGARMQYAPISDLIFDVSALIAYISTFTTLEPGDVIVTGTTGGVGAFREPPVWMQPGDVIEIEISSIGILRNTIADD